MRRGSQPTSPFVTVPGQRVRPSAGLPLIAVWMAFIAILLMATDFLGNRASFEPSVHWLQRPFSGPGFQVNDSWDPMRRATELHFADAQASIYSVTASGDVKFQYPPSSLLLHALAQTLGHPLREKWLHRVTWLAVAITLGVSAWLWFGMADGRHAAVRRLAACDRRWLAASTLILGSLFYPLMKGYSLGQVQPWLGAWFSLALIAWIADRRGLSGALIGLICLVKPQFSLFLLWGLLRAQYRFVIGWAIVFGVGTACALLVFGVADHLAYLRLLQEIARTGEAFHANQSVNGLVNRLLGNGSATVWSFSEFAPYNAVVHALTFSTSAMAIGFALWWRRREPPALLDFCVVALCFTMASPIAWEHHYGLLLPISVVLLYCLTAIEPVRRRRLAMAWWSVGWLASAFFLHSATKVGGPLGAVLQSTLFFGAGILLCLLVWRCSLEGHLPRRPPSEPTGKPATPTTAPRTV